MPNVKLHENMAGGGRAVPCGDGRHDDAKNRFTQLLWERALKDTKVTSASSTTGNQYAWRLYNLLRYN